MLQPDRWIPNHLKRYFIPVSFNQPPNTQNCCNPINWSQNILKEASFQEAFHFNLHHHTVETLIYQYVWKQINESLGIPMVILETELNSTPDVSFPKSSKMARIRLKTPLGSQYPLWLESDHCIRISKYQRWIQSTNWSQSIPIFQSLSSLFFFKCRRYSRFFFAHFWNSGNIYKKMLWNTKLISNITP